MVPKTAPTFTFRTKDHTISHTFRCFGFKQVGNWSGGEGLTTSHTHSFKIYSSAGSHSPAVGFERIPLNWCWLWRPGAFFLAAASNSSKLCIRFIQIILVSVECRI